LLDEKGDDMLFSLGGGLGSKEMAKKLGVPKWAYQRTKGEGVMGKNWAKCGLSGSF